MDTSMEQYESLIRSANRRLKGHQRRLFQAEVASLLCRGNPRAAEQRFGWGRDAVATGLHEASQGIRCVENFAARGATMAREELLSREALRARLAHLRSQNAAAADSRGN